MDVFPKKLSVKVSMKTISKLLFEIMCLVSQLKIFEVCFDSSSCPSSVFVASVENQGLVPVVP